MAQEVVIERDGGIVTVTLNRPERLNALTWAMWEGAGNAFTSLEADDDVRCIVLRGAADRAFAPGADIAEFAELRSNFEQARAYGRLMHGTMCAIAKSRHPSVALIQGICVGGGLELAMLCDIRICGEGSRFGVPINRLGVTMGYPEIAVLIKLVGRQVALEILLEGCVFGAAEAKEKGLVSRVLPDAQVAEEAYAAARRIAGGAPLSIAGTRNSPAGLMTRVRWIRRSSTSLTRPSTPRISARAIGAFSRRRRRPSADGSPTVAAANGI